ncbi:MAG: leucine-rich repeat domain-containing protein, partial [Muribaculaceae bacterium]|nr:leucine-rich repeat domain-containing protein [Muribaculaceae bacterium]
MRNPKPNPIKALTILICMMCALSASAYDFVKDGIYYNINGSNAHVTYKNTNYNSYSGTVNIPATVTYNGTTYNVSTIGPSAFQNCTNLKRVVIPNSVYYLMNNAFKGCSGLTNITIPASVGTIYNNVFEGCTFLKTVICLRPNPDQWATNNFSTTTYTYATLIVPKGKQTAYQSISDDYCWGNFNNIEEVDFDFAQDAIFYDDLGNNQAAVSNVSQAYECYSGDIVIPQTVTNNGNTYTVTSVASDAFYYGHYLSSVVLPSTINAIGSYAFYDCTNLTSVNIPEGITAINYCTFGNCQSLPSITIPSSVTWIAQNAFVNCYQLTSINCRATTPPMCVDSSCFPSNCYSNATLTVPSTALNNYKEADVWKNFSNIVSRDYDFAYNNIYYRITGPNTAEVTYKDKNYNSYSGTVNVPSTVTHNGATYTVTAVGRYAFYKSNGLTEAILPNTVTMLDYAAFADCSSLTSIEIPSSVTELGEFCFMSCAALEVIRINGEVTAIPRQCFTYCSSLHTLTWPSTIKVIGPYAFYECRKLGSLILPDDLETLQPYALANCSLLSGVTIPGKVSFVGQGVFSGCTGLYYFGVAQANQHYTAVDRCLMDISCDTLIAYPNLYSQNYTIPNGVKVIGPAAFGSCDNLLNVTIPEGVTSIESVAFSGCSNLQSVSLSNSITNIGNSAFEGCENLPSFFIPANVTTIGVAPFGRCTNMTRIQVDDNNPNFIDDDGVLYTRDGTRLIQYPGGRPDKHYSVLNTTSTIEELAFEYSPVISVYLPKSLRNMGYETFGSSQVERVVIDEGLDTIPEYTFYSCQNLKSIYLPSTIKSIGRQAFYYCVYLEDITIAVDGNAPAIGNNAFYGLAFFTDDRSANIYVPDGMASKYNGLDEWVDAYGVFNDIVSLDSGVEFTVDSLNYQTTDANLNTMVSGVTSKNLIDPGIPPKVS